MGSAYENFKPFKISASTGYPREWGGGVCLCVCVGGGLAFLIPILHNSPIHVVQLGGGGGLAFLIPILQLTHTSYTTVGHIVA